MTKAEAKECLTELGVNVHPEWTSLEMKSRITEVRKAMRHGKVKLGVTSSRRTGEIQEACVLAKVPRTGNETKGDMMRKLREKTEQDMPAAGSTLMTLGKHNGHTFQTIKAACPSYCQWANRIAEE